MTAVAATATATAAKPLVEVVDLQMHFPHRVGIFSQRELYRLRAVDGISFHIARGETLGLVGESGCGKTTAGRAILQLYTPTAGQVRYDGTDLVAMRRDRPREFHRMRQKMQMIFQDPYASLDPRMTVGNIIGEPIRTHRLAANRRDEMSRVQAVMETVGLNPQYVRRYPHEFSGGQRQRIGIARALASQPQFIVCDEPISALDVSIQAQIINLLQDLQAQLGLTMLFIAHDLSAVHHVSDRIAVMYLGHIVEIGPGDTVTRAPQHPYTEALISAVPVPDPAVEAGRRQLVLEGDLPSPANPPSGCPFVTRCPQAWERCRAERPVLQAAKGSDSNGGAPGHEVACHLIDEPDRRRT
ncbi:MAG: ABC transporter ATP-binding protein [Planctomycetota bacterium]